MSDADVTVAQLRDLVEDFVARRDWHQFHTPKNLSMSLAIEAAELMEHFQWLTAEQSRAVGGDAEKLADVGDELADVLCYALALANELESTCRRRCGERWSRTSRSIPAAEYRGRFGPRATLAGNQ